MQHDCRHDTQPGYDLVGDVLEEATRVGKPRHAAVVAYADVERPALRVGEAADPLEVLVAPRALVFDGLLSDIASSYLIFARTSWNSA